MPITALFALLSEDSIVRDERQKRLRKEMRRQKKGLQATIDLPTYYSMED